MQKLQWLVDTLRQIRGVVLGPERPQEGPVPHRGQAEGRRGVRRTYHSGQNWAVLIGHTSFYNVTVYAAQRSDV